MTNKLSQALTPEQRQALEHSLLVAENESEIYDNIRANARSRSNLLAVRTRVLAIVRAEIRRHVAGVTPVYLMGGRTATQDSRFRDAIVDLLWNREWGEAPPDAVSAYFISYEDLLANPTQQPKEATIPSVISANAQATLDELNKLIESDTPSKFLPLDQINSQDSTMTNDITIVNQTLINGKPLSSYSDSQVYDLIAQAEKKIADLEAIKTKPARLKKEIAERRTALDALIKVLDEADPKADLPAAIA